MTIILLHRFLFFLIFICLVSKIFCATDEENKYLQFIDSINKNNQVITVKNEINIPQTESLLIKSNKISFVGNDKKTSIIHFLSNDKINMIFTTNCKQIEFQNVSIIGNIQFINNDHITFKNVNYYGYFMAENTDEDSTSNMTINDSNFNLSEINQGYVVRHWNLNINNSKFFGNNFYDIHLLKFEGNSENKLNIIKSKFDGNYHNSGFQCIYGTVIINSSSFHNFFNGRNLNG